MRPADDARQHARAGCAAALLLTASTCRHEGPIDVSKFADDVEVPSFARKVVCVKCGARGRHIDVRPNWKEQPSTENLTGKVWR